jgi:hypothetical protein
MPINWVDFWWRERSRKDTKGQTPLAREGGKEWNRRGPRGPRLSFSPLEPEPAPAWLGIRYRFRAFLTSVGAT